MPITEFPTKAIGSLGPVKTDNRAYRRPSSELPAAELEAIKDAIIALYNELGLSDGSTADSVREAVNNAGGPPNPQVGELLWAWNKTDVSQFEATAFAHDRDGSDVSSKNAAAELTLTVVDAGGRLGNALRLTASSSFLGGGVFGILESEFPNGLPARYVVQVTYLVSTGTTNKIGAYLCYKAAAGAFQGIAVYRATGSASLVLQAIVNDHPLVQDSLVNSGNLDSDATARGGIVGLYSVFRQRTADNPSNTLVQSYDLSWGGGQPQHDGSLPSALSGVSTNWDGLDFDRIGIGTWGALLSGAAGTADFLDLKVYAHPDD
jgi:hypothetical protein